MPPRVLITREPSRAAELIEALLAEGISAIAEPVTYTERVADAASLPDLARVDWIAFTSANAATVFADILRESGHDLPADVRLAAVGSSTAQVVQQRLRPADIITRSGGADLAEALLDCTSGDADFTVLWPCARDSQPAFAEILESAGATITPWPVYATEFVAARTLHARLERASSFDVVVFAAPSAVKSLTVAWPEVWPFTAVAIGETTAETLRKFALTRCVTSSSPRTPDLVAAVKQALKISDPSFFPSTPQERS